MRTILLALVLAVSQLPGSHPRKPPAPGTLQPEQMRQDLDVLKAALEEAHGGLYRYSPKADVDRGFAAARRKVERRVAYSHRSALWTRTEAAWLGESIDPNISSARPRPMGIRKALGAADSAVVALVVGQQCASRWAPGPPNDPLSIVTAAVLVIVAVVVVAYFPARRANSVDPALSLRCEWGAT